MRSVKNLLRALHDPPDTPSYIKSKDKLKLWLAMAGLAVAVFGLAIQVFLNLR